MRADARPGLQEDIAPTAAVAVIESYPAGYRMSIADGP